MSDESKEMMPEMSEQAGEAGAPSGACPLHRWQEAVEMRPNEEILYELADLFKVFADSTRIKILFALMDEEMCVACIAETIDASQSAVSHQLRVLKQARLVKFRREGKQVVYSLADNHVHTMLAQGMNHVCE